MLVFHQSFWLGGLVIALYDVLRRMLGPRFLATAVFDGDSYSGEAGSAR